MGKWDRPSAWAAAKQAELEARAQVAKSEGEMGAEASSADEIAFGHIELDGATLDLHGQAEDEAWSNTRDFLDQQVYIGEKGAKIMHGIGKGILKKMLMRELPRYHSIKAIRPSTKPGERDAVLLVLFK